MQEKILSYLTKYMRMFHNVNNKEKNEQMILYQSLVIYYVWRDIYEHEG